MVCFSHDTYNRWRFVLTNAALNDFSSSCWKSGFSSEISISVVPDSVDELLAVVVVMTLIDEDSLLEIATGSLSTTTDVSSEEKDEHDAITLFSILKFLTRKRFVFKRCRCVRFLCERKACVNAVDGDVKKACSKKLPLMMDGNNQRRKFLMHVLFIRIGKLLYQARIYCIWVSPTDIRHSFLFSIFEIHESCFESWHHFNLDVRRVPPPSKKKLC